MPMWWHVSGKLIPIRARRWPLLRHWWFLWVDRYVARVSSEAERHRQEDRPWGDL
jgi:hypothetical protein